MVMVRQAEWHDHRAACASAHSHGAHATATVACGNGEKNSPKCRVPTPTMWASETAGSTVRSRCAHPLGNENLCKKPGLNAACRHRARVPRVFVCAWRAHRLKRVFADASVDASTREDPPFNARIAHHSANQPVPSVLLSGRILRDSHTSERARRRVRRP